jgi:hypothetical protein
MYAIDSVTRSPVNFVVSEDQLFVKGFPGDRWQYAPPTGGITSSTAPVTLKAAVAGKRNYIASAQFSATAGTGDHEIIVKSGATVIHRGAVDLGASADRGGSFVFPTGLAGGVGEALTVEMSVSDPGNVFINAQGFTY